MSESGHDPAEHDPAEHDPAEHDPAESARPSIGPRDEPDAMRPDTDDRPHRTLPPRDDSAAEGGSDSPRPTESPGPGR